MRTEKKTLYYLILSILFINILYLIVTLLFFQFKISSILGILLGAVTAVGLVFHMFHTIDNVLDFDAETAKKIGARNSALRILIMAVVLGISFVFPTIFHPLGTFFGMLSLKFGALLQPIIQLLFQKRNKFTNTKE